MKSTFSFHLSRLVVPVRRVHIAHGHGRNCQDCAISMAIRDAFADAGLPQWGTYFVPYACFRDALGLILGESEWRPMQTAFARLPVRDLPIGIDDWARNFDDWQDFDGAGETARQYERRTGDYAPILPWEQTFVFDLTKLVPCTEVDL